MCIIAYAPAGVQIADKTIKRMFKNNPDGAGIMWKPTENSAVEIRKGFMKVEDLLDAYHKIPQDCEKAIHCRIATSGKVSAACCHPFPVRPKTTAMREPVDTAEIAFMHNGVFSFSTPLKGMKANYSDSMLFGAKFLYPMQKMLDMECLQTLIEEASTSRLLIFRHHGETIMLGNWQSEQGVFYSNGGYKDTPLYTYSDKYWRSYTGYGYKPIDDCPNTVQTGIQAPTSYYGWLYLDINVDPRKALQEINDALLERNFDVTYSEFYTYEEAIECYFEVDSLTGEKPPKNIAGYTNFTWE